MTFAEARLSLQLEAEERIGARLRYDAQNARAVEDTLANAQRAQLGGQT